MKTYMFPHFNGALIGKKEADGFYFFKNERTIKTGIVTVENGKVSLISGDSFDQCMGGTIEIDNAPFLIDNVISDGLLDLQDTNLQFTEPVGYVYYNLAGVVSKEIGSYSNAIRRVSGNEFKFGMSGKIVIGENIFEIIEVMSKDVMRIEGENFYTIDNTPFCYNGLTGVLNANGTSLTLVSGNNFPTGIEHQTIWIDGLEYPVSNFSSESSGTLIQPCAENGVFRFVIMRDETLKQTLMVYKNANVFGKEIKNFGQVIPLKSEIKNFWAGGYEIFYYNTFLGNYFIKSKNKLLHLFEDEDRKLKMFVLDEDGIKSETEIFAVDVNNPDAYENIQFIGFEGTESKVYISFAVKYSQIGQYVEFPYRGKMAEVNIENVPTVEKIVDFTPVIDSVSMMWFSGTFKKNKTIYAFQSLERWSDEKELLEVVKNGILQKKELPLGDYFKKKYIGLSFVLTTNMSDVSDMLKFQKLNLDSLEYENVLPDVENVVPRPEITNGNYYYTTVNFYSAHNFILFTWLRPYNPMGVPDRPPLVPQCFICNNKNNIIQKKHLQNMIYFLSDISNLSSVVFSEDYKYAFGFVNIGGYRFKIIFIDFEIQQIENRTIEECYDLPVEEIGEELSYKYFVHSEQDMRFVVSRANNEKLTGLSKSGFFGIIKDRKIKILNWNEEKEKLPKVCAPMIYELERIYPNNIIEKVL